MLANSRNHIFVGRRIDSREGDWWQMPQGGIDDGEDLEAAALRELWEETGIPREKITILARSSTELYYDLPPELVGKLWQGRYLGQRQTWFLMRFDGDDADINLEAHDPPEFCDWKWIAPQRLPALIIPFKVATYEAVLSEFLPLLQPQVDQF